MWLGFSGSRYRSMSSFDGCAIVVGVGVGIVVDDNNNGAAAAAAAAAA
eukprot:CAMPEP_0202451956 /NCGR_PEP_ID=MMETSP1360-20130828/10256_1 /ASSEMBLY_ACC=CAM_ASM_000848 /TAXON_ID=515479 /ORGANISM="Licmophora paradoxa, Strain CCMP2313" /LENGTH=47 /DNA_ID= /DNA_START= /DNA_END= /DNA_ORIENTATION=